MTSATSPSSRQVAWFETYTFASRIAAQRGYSLTAAQLPAPGTPTWCGMPDSDARKLLSLLLRGVQAALADDATQAASADASREISTAADWRALAQRTHRGRGPAYIPRKRINDHQPDRRHVS